MNACGVDKACKSNDPITRIEASLLVDFHLWDSGERASNTLVTYPVLGDNHEKSWLIPDGLERVKVSAGTGGA